MSKKTKKRRPNRRTYQRPGRAGPWGVPGGGPSLSMLILAGGAAAAKGDEMTFEEVSLALLDQANSLAGGGLAPN